MAKWSKRAMPLADLHKLGLTPEEGFVLSRLDVPLTSSEVIALTGIAAERVEEIMVRLARAGAVEGEGGLPPAAEEPQAEPNAEEGEHEDDEQGEAEDEEQVKLQERNYRKMYETEYHALPVDRRVAAAGSAKGAHLFALCFDADPVVIRAVLANPEAGLPHGRLAARHHRNVGGLEAIAQRGDLFMDGQVQRLLLRNVQLSEALVKRILAPKRMLDSYKISVDTDVPERTRQFARGVLRSKFSVAQGEERAGLICATDGRVLAALAGLSFDARATQILCARSYTSPLFVQALARFGACPPQLLAHLLKQPIVRRQQHLKGMLLQHPNMPVDAKRKL